MHNSALHQPQVMNCQVVQRSQLEVVQRSQLDAELGRNRTQLVFEKSQVFRYNIHMRTTSSRLFLGIFQSKTGYELTKLA